MARASDVSKFSTTKYEETVREMKKKGEKVGDKGRQVYDKTGKLDQMVNVSGVNRLSRNAFSKNENGTYTLVNGIKVPIVFMVDGTGSMGENVEKAFYAMKEIYAMLGSIKRYQLDLSFSVVQDVGDSHPVFQMSQFESDSRAADQVTMLIPDKDGGDAIEDYEFGLWYLDNAVETDIIRYGLKGYFFLVADQIGRGTIYKDDVKQHLDHSMQANSISTKNICNSLIEKWNFFYINVGGSSSTTEWWSKKIGQERVIEIDDPDLLAEVQAALVYISENLEPTKDGLEEFLFASGGNKKVTKNDVNTIWGWLQTAESLFGAQAKAAGYNNIPMPGDVFKDIRDVWPVGHTTEENSDSTPTPPTDVEPMNWSKL
jgi:hypothetical protein